MKCFNWESIKNEYHYRYWQKKYQIKVHIQNIESYFACVNGYALSKQARETQPNLALTYGEIDLESFLALLSMIKLNTDSIFYDLGCGLGKTVIACADVYGVKRAYGIEFLPELLVVAKNYALTNPQVQFLNQDILLTDWSDANVLFLNVATFLPDTWQAICHRLLKYPVNTIITCGKALPKSAPYQVRETQVKTSWGPIRAYIHHMRG